jgi:hypothetical protein
MLSRAASCGTTASRRCSSPPRSASSPTRPRCHARSRVHPADRRACRGSASCLVLAGGVGAGKTTAATFVAAQGRATRGRGSCASTSSSGAAGTTRSSTSGSRIRPRSSSTTSGPSPRRQGRVSLAARRDRRHVLRQPAHARHDDEPAPGPRIATDKEDQFRERYGERIWSRLGQVAMWGDCGTRDLRREASR